MPHRWDAAESRSAVMSVRLRRLLGETVGTLAIFGVVAAVGVALALPWRARAPAGGPLLERFAPQRDGDAVLTAELDPGGTVRGWSSRNTTVVGAGRVGLFGLRTASTFAITRRYGMSERADTMTELRTRLAHVAVIETHERKLAADGRLTSTTLTSVRDDDGESVVAVHEADTDTDLVFDPALRVLSADLQVGATWEGEGRFGDVAQYRVEGEILAPEPRTDTFDPDDPTENCLRVRVRLVLLQNDRPVRDTTTEDRVCEGVGAVGSREYDEHGDLTGSTVRLSARDRAPLVAPDLARGSATAPSSPSASAASMGAASGPSAGAGTSSATALAGDVTGEPTRAVLGSPEAWRLVTVGRSSSTASVASTVLPLWIPTDPPAVLAVSYSGDLVAFDAADPTGSILWRFHPEGTIYGPPAFDSVRGSVYVGASDRRVYALDARGLFLWSFQAGDNVATRPLVAGAVVVVGSEDGWIYGLDADTGKERWRMDAGAPVVSAPALAQGTAQSDPQGGSLSDDRAVAIVGSDRGTVYALDAASGEELWRYDASGAVEAPIVVADGRAYVASHAGAVAALDVADGAVLWTGSVSPSGRASSVLPAVRTAPAVGDDLVAIVDQFGLLVALDAADGHMRWTLNDRGYVGPPVLVEGGMIVAGKDGGVFRIDLDGRPSGAWPTPPSPDAVPGTVAGFDFGPPLGGGALWLADTKASVHRLGAPTGAPLLEPAWSLSVFNAPLNRDILSLPAAEYGGRAVVIDASGGLSLIDPTTGAGVRAGRLALDGGTASTDPVVAGDTVLVSTGGALHAARLPDARALWTAPGGGRSYHPPVVADDAVVWLTQPADASAGAVSATLSVHDLASGSVRWSMLLAGIGVAGGVVVHDGVVYVSTQPAAFDLGTGAPRWRADVVGTVSGGAALSPSGDTLFVVAAGGGGAGPALLALGTADGRERWRTGLGAVAASIRERPWVTGDTVVIGLFSGEVIGLDAASGAERWRYRPPVTRYGAVGVEDGLVLLTLENGQLVALDAATGEVVARSRRLSGTFSGRTLGPRPTLVGQVIVAPLGTVLVGYPRP